jgi:hypothetical protein
MKFASWQSAFQHSPISKAIVPYNFIIFWNLKLNLLDSILNLLRALSAMWQKFRKDLQISFPTLLPHMTDTGMFGKKSEGEYLGVTKPAND